MSDRLVVLTGDCLIEMRKLPAESVHLIVTSPPYWGLRDYGVPPSIWGASEACEHKWVEHVQPAANGICHDAGMSGETLSGNSATRKPKRSGFCSKCNAWRGVFGLEPTPELYIEHFVLIMREVKRVLRKDGTLWLNLGDSYASDTKWGGETGGKHAVALHGQEIGRARRFTGLKQGDLVGIPWRAVFALQADGWWHRRDNIWFKPNPMPESVNGWRWERHRIKVGLSARATDKSSHARSQNGVNNPHGARDGVNFADHSAEYVDCVGCSKCHPNGGLVLRKGNWRCTTSHEYVFQFSKSDSYFCNAEAAREDGTERPSGNKKRFIAKKDGDRGRINNHLGSAIPYCPNGSGRNLRSVWRISTKPYREAHFATFPPDLVRPIIAAASPEQCCGQCGAPYAPIVERGEPRREQQMACGSDDAGEYNGKATKDFLTGGAEDASAVKARILAGMVEKRVTGHRPTCLCGAISAPAVVLDPFGGSGTTGMVALELGRHAILIELNTSYVKLIEKRCQVTPGLGV